MDSVINAASPSLIDDRISFAQIELAGMMVVIESVHVMLALDRPPTLTRLPRSHAAIDGVFSHDGQVVPLVDLRKWLEPGVEPVSVMP
jgi:chemotaxis signal transduction protein